MKLSTNKDYQIDASTLECLDASIFEIISKGVTSEYDLIKALQAEPYQLFSSKSLAKTLTLFHTHFFVFNSLFRLKQQGEATGEFSLHIEASAIKLYPENTKINDSRHENLAKYYLDWKNIEASQEQVELLISSFWVEYDRYNNLVTINASNETRKKTPLIK